MKIFVGAGEPSGDRILSLMLRGLHSHFPDMKICGFGGPLCAEQGLQSLIPMRRLAVSGIGDVLRRGSTLVGSYLRLKRKLRNFHPDLVLLVDYPGMNVSLAQDALRLGYRVHYVAPPQLWAYRHPEGRLRRLREKLEGASLQVLFPFEGECYSPWAGQLRQGHFFPPPAEHPPSGTRLLLCPGSRPDLLRRNLPLWLNHLSKGGWKGGVDVLTPGFLVAEVKALIGKHPDAEVFTDSNRAFSRAASAIAFPGTMTLELFLRRIPTRVWAVLDPLTLWMGKRKLRPGFIALPNLLLGKETFKEWVGTVRDFKNNPPSFDSLGKVFVEDEDVAAIQKKMGSADGVEVGVLALTSICPTGYSVSGASLKDEKRRSDG